jgi:hypothetical protein
MGTRLTSKSQPVMALAGIVFEHLTSGQKTESSLPTTRFMVSNGCHCRALSSFMQIHARALMNAEASRRLFVIIV